jgi:chitinase domain-containing protein 1
MVATAATRCTLVPSVTKVATQKKFLGKSSRGAQRLQTTKVRAAPIFEIAEEALGAVSEAVTTVSPDILDAYQSSALGSSTTKVVEEASNASMLSGGDSELSPLLIAGAAVIALGGPLLAFFLRQPGAKSLSAAAAFNVLADTPDSVLIDLRPKADVKEYGSPDLRSVGGRRKYVKIPTDEQEFDVESFERAVRDKEVVIFLDSYGGFAKKATEALQRADEIFQGEAAYVIDGTVGPGGWLNSDMPWRKPFSLSLPSVDKLVENYKEDPSPTNTALTVLGGLSLASYVFVEYEGLVELLSVFVGGSFLASKFLLAEDRETTNRQISEFLNTKKAPEDFVQEMEQFKEKVSPEKVSSSEDVVDTTTAKAEAAVEVEEKTAEVFEEVVKAKVETVEEEKTETETVQQAAEEEENITGGGELVTPAAAEAEKEEEKPVEKQPEKKSDLLKEFGLDR